MLSRCVLVRFPMDFKQAGHANGKGGCFPIRGRGVVVVSADSVGDLIAGEQVEVGHVPVIGGLDFASGCCDDWKDVVCVVVFLVSELQARDAVVVKGFGNEGDAHRFCEVDVLSRLQQAHVGRLIGQRDNAIGYGVFVGDHLGIAQVYAIVPVIFDFEGRLCKR